MYRYTPDEIDRVRASHQAEWNNDSNIDEKRVGNLGEMAFETFLRQYVPTEMWEWMNADALRNCNPESYEPYDFDVFGYAVDVKTSRDVSAFRPSNLLAIDDTDDIIVMVWHRDNEDALILLGWERIETLRSKVETEYEGKTLEQLDHLPARSMTQLLDLGPSTAQMNQRIECDFAIGDRVQPADDDDPTVGVVVDLLPTDLTSFGSVVVAFEPDLTDGPGDWEDLHPAKLASYTDDQSIRTWNYSQDRLVAVD
jgi:hypothetical protein